MGGGNAVMLPIPHWRQGLSPRGRGKPVCAHCPPKRGGSIPAWAGETQPTACEASARAVYPRVGGGNRAATGGFAVDVGLSPRGRGKHLSKV